MLTPASYTDEYSGALSDSCSVESHFVLPQREVYELRSEESSHMKKMKVTSTALLAASGMLLLAACSAPGGQSVAEACQVAEDTMSEAVEQTGNELGEAMNALVYGEEFDASATFAPIVDSINEAAGLVKNSEVKSALKEFGEGFKSFSEMFANADIPSIDASNMGDVRAIEEQAAKLEEFSKSMEAETREFEASANAIAELCESN